MGGREARRAALVACLVAAACRPAPPAPERLVIANARVAQTALVSIAAAKGFFAEEGLEVEVRPFPFGRPALAAALAGEVDVATVAETPVAFAALQGRAPAVLATISRTTRNYGLLVRRAADGPQPAVRDLAGKRVGVSRGTSGEFFLETVMVRNRILRSAVTLVDMPPTAMEAALRRGEVDAVATWNPHLAELGKALGDQVAAAGESDYAESFLVAARADFPVKRREAAVRLLRALVRAEALARSRPEEAMAIESAALQLSPGDLAAIWSPSDLQVRLDQSLLVLMDEVARWAIRGGLVAPQPTPDFRAVLAAEPLAAARPDAVHLIR